MDRRELTEEEMDHVLADVWPEYMTGSREEHSNSPLHWLLMWHGDQREWDRDRVLDEWGERGYDLPLYLLPFYTKRYNVCTMINHTQGRGCQRSHCKRPHTCMLCGKNGHGCEMSDSTSGEYACRLRSHLEKQLTAMRLTSRFDLPRLLKHLWGLRAQARRKSSQDRDQDADTRPKATTTSAASSPKSSTRSVSPETTHDVEHGLSVDNSDSASEEGNTGKAEQDDVDVTPLEHIVSSNTLGQDQSSHTTRLPPETSDSGDDGWDTMGMIHDHIISTPITPPILSGTEVGGGDGLSSGIAARVEASSGVAPFTFTSSGDEPPTELQLGDHLHPLDWDSLVSDMDDEGDVMLERSIVLGVGLGSAGGTSMGSAGALLSPRQAEGGEEASAVEEILVAAELNSRIFLCRSGEFAIAQSRHSSVWKAYLEDAGVRQPVAVKLWPVPEDEAQQARVKARLEQHARALRLLGGDGVVYLCYQLECNVGLDAYHMMVMKLYDETLASWFHHLSSHDAAAAHTVSFGAGADGGSSITGARSGDGVDSVAALGGGGGGLEQDGYHPFCKCCHRRFATEATAVATSSAKVPVPCASVQAARVRNLTLQLIAVLDNCHRQGLIHGDLRPENILVDHSSTWKEGLPYPRLVLSDFGVTKSLEDSNNASYTPLTVPGNTAQCWHCPDIPLVGPRRVTAAVDVWGLGCVVFFMATGTRVLFRSLQEVMDTTELPSQLTMLAGQPLMQNLVVCMVHRRPNCRIPLHEANVHPALWAPGRVAKFALQVCDQYLNDSHSQVQKVVDGIPMLRPWKDSLVDVGLGAMATFLEDHRGNTDLSQPCVVGLLCCIYNVVHHYRYANVGRPHAEILNEYGGMLADVFPYVVLRMYYGLLQAGYRFHATSEVVFSYGGLM